MWDCHAFPPQLVSLPRSRFRSRVALRGEGVGQTVRLNKIIPLIGGNQPVICDRNRSVFCKQWHHLYGENNTPSRSFLMLRYCSWVEENASALKKKNTRVFSSQIKCVIRRRLGDGIPKIKYEQDNDRVNGPSKEIHRALASNQKIINWFIKRRRLTFSQRKEKETNTILRS